MEKIVEEMCVGHAQHVLFRSLIANTSSARLEAGLGSASSAALARMAGGKSAEVHPDLDDGWTLDRLGLQA
jgi:hypothetical protein